MSTTNAVQSVASTARTLWISGDTMHLLATGDDTAGRLLVLEVLAEPGGGPPPHIHHNEDESFYVLDGEFEIVRAHETIRAGAGTFAHVPRGTIHRFSNVGSSPSRILIMFTPAGIEGFFRAAGVPAVAGLTAPPVDAAEIARTQLAAPRYGLELALGDQADPDAAGQGRSSAPSP
jgi:quercetin dioxygenase-like cupin family protein